MREDFLHVDVRALPGLDVQAAAALLPFPDATFAEVYARHVLEHFMLKEAVDVVLEWRRVLQPGGLLHIIVPNVLWHFRQVLEGSHQSVHTSEPRKNARYWGMGSIYGWQQDGFDVHKFGYWPELLAELLGECGFAGIRNLTNHPEGREHADWHLEMTATKGPNVGNPDRFRRLLDVSH